MRQKPHRKSEERRTGKSVSVNRREQGPIPCAPGPFFPTCQARKAQAMTDDVTLYELAVMAAEALYNGRCGIGGVHHIEIARLERRLSRLTPEALMIAERTLGNALRDVAWREPARMLPQPAAQIAPLLVSTASDGHLREQAVRCMTPQSGDLAMVMFVMMRTNDWVPQVRATAQRKLDAALPGLSEKDLRQLVPFVLLRSGQWGRSSGAALIAMRQHPDWAEAVVSVVIEADRGPLARIMRAELCSDALDPLLFRLATQARSLQVRAVATEVLLSAEARWQIGRRREWICKPQGLSRCVPVFETRRLMVASEQRDAILWVAGQSRWSLLRRLAADFAQTCRRCVDPARAECGPRIG